MSFNLIWACKSEKRCQFFLAMEMPQKCSLINFGLFVHTFPMNDFKNALNYHLIKFEHTKCTTNELQNVLSIEKATKIHLFQLNN